MGIWPGRDGDRTVSEAPAPERGHAALLGAIEGCRLCRDAPDGPPLPHEPRPVLQIGGGAKICIAGQAPGTRVHESGRPFTDPSGDRLRDWMGIGPELFYDPARIAIVPMGLCFPGLDAKGGDLPPRKECAPQWRTRIFRLLPELELIVAVGLYAQKWHLGRRARASLTETVRSWRDYAAPASGPQILPLPHPSWRNNGWLKRNPWFESELLPVLKARIRELTGG
ncbi:MAG: uracil-DNA glycosylase [Hyphomicrobiales bacterium]|nr:MAG: uracil-DNA glycosylase [Hyphomicrobiales bacterium]